MKTPALFRRMLPASLVVAAIAILTTTVSAQSGSRYGGGSPQYRGSSQTRPTQQYPTQQQLQAQARQREAQQAQARQRQAEQAQRRAQQQAQRDAKKQAQQAQRQAAKQREMQQKEMMQVAADSNAQVGLEGYCPVCIVKLGKWVIGASSHSVTYDGTTYFFPGEDTKQTFMNDPAKYVPALGGDCIVCYEKHDKRKPGNIRHTSLFNDRLYMFPSAEEHKVFDQTPGQYENSDLASDGNCIVCLVKMDKTVKGSPEFTAVHDGLRYLFPSDSERQVFVESPEQFVTAAAKSMMDESKQASDDRMMDKMQGDAMLKGKMKGEMKKGMEQDTSMLKHDGKFYKQRFGGQRVDVSGTVIKTEGNIAWVKPSQLIAL